MKKTTNNKKIIRYFVSGFKNLENFWWTCFLFFISIGFLLTGFSSYYNKNLFWFINNQNIQFFPQGFIMICFGLIGIILAIFLTLVLLWGIGSGFNEFNKQNLYIRIFRWGFPGTNRCIDLYYSWENVLKIIVELNKGLFFQYIIFLEVKEKNKKKYKIPLINIGNFITFEEIEKQISALSKFLKIPISIKV
uniref:Photosystem I assembly protein Ycf4 n=1 Tax=Boodleopsis sp. H.0758 TaxID=2320802 RepID=A0A386AZS0_9CHLO|nr:photosystem I assembly protein Ycf4 [Boodleopsis sp. H.0758]AYC64931.1 photosystem I assembly protein Ycf4 [Boodleopsis sp. H.0758]